MADRFIKVCDLHHDEEQLAQRRTFAIDGVEYVLDCCEEHMVAFEQAWSPYVKAGRRVGRVNRPAKPRQSTSSTVEADPAEVREWAAANGHEVSDRGRIPVTVMAAWESANGWATAR